MSSPGLPTLNLELRSQRGAMLVGLGAPALALPTAFLVDGTALAGVVAATCAMGLVFWFRRIGWLGGPRRLTRIAWHTDGVWVLCDASGRTSEARLARASRVAPFAIWLAWRPATPPARPSDARLGVGPLLLLRRDLAAVDFRRLVVRLRLSDRLIPSAAESDRRDGASDEP